MKKLLTRFLFIFVIIFVMPIMPAVNAEDRVYYISAYNIIADIQTDGSAIIEEKLTYNFSGSFNGILLDVDYADTSGISDVEAYVIRNGQPDRLKLNAGNRFDDSGEPGTYNYMENDELASFKIFERSRNESKTFLVRYRLSDVVTTFSDVSTFNRKLIGTGWETRLDNVSITITLPEGANKDELKVFAHGPLTGESEIVDGRTLFFKVPSVSPGTFVETLVVFPNRLVPENKNIVDKAALPGIMENEARLAEEANREREEAALQAQREREQQEKIEKTLNTIRTVALPVIFLLILFWFVILFYLYFKYDKELKHGFEGKYYRELPGEYSPAEMSVLMSFGYVKPRDIMATLLDLVRRKHLTLTVRKTSKTGFFGTVKEETDYVFAISDTPPQELLKKHENFLIAWFIDRIGDGREVSLDGIKTYVKRRKNALQFKSDYDRWCNYAVGEAERNKFFDHTVKKGRILGILAGLLYFAAGFMLAFFLFIPLALILALQGVIMFIFAARLKRRTAYGSEQHAMWLAFKNFLKDFSNLEKAEIPSLVLWEHYLVYAVSLGVAQEVIDQLPRVYTDNDFTNTNLTFMRGAVYGYHYGGFASMFSNTIRTMEGAITSATAIANSARSSASGGGGGFSGGSSGGGGGRGGGGAF